jgi:acyl carrier protein
MLAVEGQDIDGLLDLARQQQEDLTADIACYNGPQSFVIAGDEVSIRAIEVASKTSRNSFRMKRLDNTHAFHSRILDGIIPDLLSTARGLHFKAPRIPIEACSDDDDWSMITPEKIARHTRMAVHFMDAVRRIEQQMDGPVMWVESGSGSPIIPMIKRAVDPRLTEINHIYVASSLQDSDSQANLAKISCHLWSKGVRVQFWPFHKSQSWSYDWVNLPPYQFARTSHWLDYQPSTTVWKTPIESVTDMETELVKMLGSGTQQGETLFAIEPSHELYQLATKGHEVVDQTLCPASMYIEFVLTASRILSSADLGTVPRVSCLAMSSPLVLNPTGVVRIKLVEGEPGSWDFTIFSQDTQTMQASHTEHSTGRVTISRLSVPTPISQLRSVKAIIRNRCGEIESSPDSTGFKGPTAYQAMRRVVTYLDYYHGLQSFYALGTEAVAHITLPSTRPANMGVGFYDPVLIDSFTQISGVLANCFALEDDGDMWVCNFIGDIVFTQEFVDTGRKQGSWIAYAKYEKPSPRRLECDIFVFDPQSGNIVVNIVSITFQKVSIKSLSRILSRLNTSKNPMREATAQDREVFHRQEITDMSVRRHNPLAEHTREMHSESAPAKRTDHSSSVQGIKKMLSDILEAPIEEISTNSILTDLGIDSLLGTEIFAEMKKRFHVSISHSDFASITDVEGLARMIPSQASEDLYPVFTQNLAPAAPPLADPVIAIANGEVQPLEKIKRLLGDILEIPLEEISGESSLDDLGVDSLLATEIFAEIKKTFGVSVSHSEFAKISQVQGLAYLMPGTIAPEDLPPAQSSRVELETVIYGERDGLSLSADIYYPENIGRSQTPLPIGAS